MDKSLMTHCRITGIEHKHNADNCEMVHCVNCGGVTSKAELNYRESKRCSYCGNPVDVQVN